MKNYACHRPGPLLGLRLLRGRLQDGEPDEPGRGAQPRVRHRPRRHLPGHRDVLAAHAVPAVRESRLHRSVPHRRLLPRRGDRHRARERRGLHRLRELSDGLPLRRAPAEPEDQHHREVHAVLPAQKRRELGAGLRAQLLLRRSHLRETWTIRTPRPRRSWLPPARTRTTCSIRPTCIPRRSTSSRRRPPSGRRSPSRSPATRRSSHFA